MYSIYQTTLNNSLNTIPVNYVNLTHAKTVATYLINDNIIKLLPNIGHKHV